MAHGHCHQRSVMGTDPDRRIMERMGLDVHVPPASCCGMAGAFGFEAEHYDISVQIGEHALLPAVRDADPDTLIIADGFSCREQIRQLTDRSPLHLAEVLRMARSAAHGSPLDPVPWYRVYLCTQREEDAMDGLRSGEVAERAGISVEALRFYQRKGLVPEPPRSANGYRRFPPETVRRLRFIQRAQTIGFSLAEIGELLDLRVDPETDCDEVRNRAAMRLRQVEEKIGDLERVRATLDSLVDACAQRSASSECPILEALEPAEAS